MSDRSDAHHSQDRTLLSRAPGYIPWLCCLVIMLLSLADASLPAPSTRLLESAVCRRYFDVYEPEGFRGGSDIPEEFCKSDEIQVEFAWVYSFITIFTDIVDLVVQVPIGVMADFKGRRLALILNITSALGYWSWLAVTCLLPEIFPYWSIFLCPLAFLIGGGPSVSAALLDTIISDVAPEKQRTTFFAYLTASGQFVSVFAPLIGSALMDVNLALPFVFAALSFAFAYVPALWIPDTRHLDRKPSFTESDSDESTASQPLLGETDESDGRSTDASLRPHDDVPSRLSRKLRNVYTNVVRACRFIMRDRDFSLSVAMLFLKSIAKCNDFLLQYVSKRYGWKIAKAGYLFSLEAGVSIFLCIVLIPLANKMLLKHTALGASGVSILIIQASFAVQVNGSLFMALAPEVWIFITGLVIWTLGLGASITIRSLLAAKIHKSHLARAYTILGTVQALGSVLGTPLSAATFSWGLKGDSWALGAPYYLDVILYALTLGLSAKLSPVPEENGDNGA